MTTEQMPQGWQDSTTPERSFTDPAVGGVCPYCHTTNGYVNAGLGHWGICDTHKVMWFIGANLFTVDETEEAQKKVWNEHGFDDYEVVDSFMPPEAA
jgi:hypothetical protein